MQLKHLRRLKLSKNSLFSHLIVINIIDINIGVNFLNHSIASARKELCIGMHSQRLTAIYLQNTNDTFHYVA